WPLNRPKTIFWRDHPEPRRFRGEGSDPRTAFLQIFRLRKRYRLARKLFAEKNSGGDAEKPSRFCNRSRNRLRSSLPVWRSADLEPRRCADRKGLHSREIEKSKQPFLRLV